MTITIIGGGIIGLTTAFELTERGDNVHLIDAETSDYDTAADGTAIYPAASHYAGGMLAPCRAASVGRPLSRRADEAVVPWRLFRASVYGLAPSISSQRRRKARQTA